MALGFLLNQVQNAISNHAGQQQQTGFNPSGLLSEVESLFGQHAANTGQILGSSQDPYGDPANQGGGILPSSMDPYGDPANQR